MPAYFSLVVECSKQCIEKNIMSDFYTLLIDNGLTYIGVYDNAANFSLSEIAEKNQYYLLNENNDRNNDNTVWDFLQINFQFLDFSETRVFIIDDPNDDYFTFQIIIPENDLVVGDYEKVSWNQAKVKKLLCLSKQIWKRPYVNSIQTELEISDGFCSLYEITQGNKPSVEPFAIISGKGISNRFDEFSIVEQVEREGVILLNWNATDFVWNLIPNDWKEHIRSQRKRNELD